MTKNFYIIKQNFITYIVLCVEDEDDEDIHDVLMNFQFTIKFFFSCFRFSLFCVLLLELYLLSSTVLGPF